MSKAKVLGLGAIYRILNLLTHRVRISKLIKFKLAIGLALIATKNTQAQTVEFPNRKNQKDVNTLDVNLKPDIVVLCYDMVMVEPLDKEPEYKTGDQGLNEFVREHMVYPDSALLHHIEGSVTVNINVDKNGKILDATVIQGLGYGLDEEALRLVKMMPKFKPGIEDGKKTGMNKSIVIYFDLPVE